MKHMPLLIISLCINAALLLSSCGKHLTIPDTTLWSYVGSQPDPRDETKTIAAIGSHTNFKKREYKNLDEYLIFIATSVEEKRGPAISLSAYDATILKNIIDQACALITCNYEEQQFRENLKAHLELFKDGIYNPSLR